MNQELSNYRDLYYIISNSTKTYSNHVLNKILYEILKDNEDKELDNYIKTYNKIVEQDKDKN